MYYKNYKTLVLFFYFILFCIVFFLFSNLTDFDFSRSFDTDYLKIKGIELKSLLDSNYILFFVIYIIFYIIYMSLLPIPLPVVIISSVIFNPLVATLISTICISIGSLIFFSLLNLGIMPKFESIKLKNNKIIKKLKKKEFLSILIFRLTGGGGLPFLLQNLVLYYSGVKSKNYFFGTIMGIIPGTFLLSVLGISIFTGIKMILFN